MGLSTKNRLLIFANDAASANVTAAYAFLYKDIYSEVLAFANGAALKIYKEYIPTFISNKDIKFELDDTVVTGTSGIDSSYEMGILKSAKQFGVKNTITLIDNISNFNMRFTLDDKLIQEQFIPNEIWVFQDDFKSEIEYLNEKIVYKNHIYYEFLNKLYSSGKPKIKHDFIKKYKNQYLVVLTEYLYELYGLKFGFTEYDMLENILSIIDELSLELPIFLKLHPRENPNKFNILLRKYSHLNIVKDECNIQELIYFSKCVFGINSSVFTECNFFKKDTYSIQIDSFKNMEVNTLEKDRVIYNKNDLKKLISTI